MFLKKTYVKQGNRQYLYGQVVESVRRASDGKPTHRVVASMGRISEELADNLQRAFKAARLGKPVVMVSEATARALPPTAHYTYLSVGVLLELWRRWRLEEVLAQLARGSQRQLPFEDAVAALVLHRCLDPGSKLEASRWFPETALPELLGCAPRALNNTRIHRALARLAEHEDALQRAVAAQILDKRGRYRALFVDVTDTWFTGRGPSLAESRKTKEGLWRLKIGIVLVCTDEGLPLRWKVLAGRQGEQEIMLQAGDWLRQCGFALDEPVVIDRIMGQVKSLADLKAHDIRFVTALRSQAIRSFLGEHELLGLADGIDPGADEAEGQLAQAAQRLGMVPAGEVWAFDLGLLDPSVPEHLRPSPHTERARQALRQAHALQRERDTQPTTTWKQAAAALGITSGRASKVRPLLRLAEPIQQMILAGECTISVSQLAELARLEEAEQLAQCREAHEHRPAKVPLDATSRVVAFFHPRRFVLRRKDIQANRDELDAQLEDLNQRLATPQSRRARASIEREVRNKLLKPKAFEALFDLTIEAEDHDGRERWRVRLTPNEAWHQARQLDGFLVLAAHPEANVEPVELASLYDDKNIIECDFRTIKSALRLRPVYVHTDPKVCAHVSVCMLALLLHRALEIELGSGALTASRALKALEKVYLNAVQLPGATSTGAYTLTQASTDQLDLLKALNMEHLVDPNTLPATLNRR